LSLQGQTDASMSDELVQVANGFDLRVKSFTGYDVNGYRFHTVTYEQSRPHQKTKTTEFLRPTLMASTTMGELRKSINFHFMEINLLLLFYSSATGLILDK
jgi:hypothetical protein